MEDLHLLFPVKIPSQDSGFGENDSILFPYFLQDVPFSCDQGSYEIYATVDFSGEFFFLVGGWVDWWVGGGTEGERERIKE